MGLVVSREMKSEPRRVREKGRGGSAWRRDGRLGREGEQGREGVATEAVPREGEVGMGINFFLILDFYNANFIHFEKKKKSQ